MNQQSSPDIGTELESLESLRERYGDAVFSPQAGGNTKRGTQRTALEPVPASIAEQSFRPTMRPATPRLTLLDDGESVSGEVIRLRETVTVIGRSDGDVRIPHDSLISKKHAELIREGTGLHSQWLLRDLDSANHTFVSCSTSLLQPNRLILLGSLRFRFQPPGAPIAAAGPVEATSRADVPKDQLGLWPALVATTSTGPDGIVPLSGISLTVGRPGAGNDIEIDDPLIAARHALITRQPSGQWQIKAMPSRNGVWVQIKTVRLTSLCRFQCGEQRFLFSL